MLDFICYSLEVVKTTIRIIKQKIEYITNTTTVDMYINDLNELRKELEKDFK